MTKGFLVSISAASLVWCAVAHAQQSSPPAKSTAAAPGMAAPANSQAAPKVPATDSTDLAEIVVTGSLTISDGSRAPTPVTVVSGDQLETAMPGTIAQALNELPEFRGSNTPANGQLSATGPNSGSFLNLRNLGAQRTLVLLDGRRAAPSTIVGTVDTNVLPQELVKRVDIVTGGASAAYGSDAVAGVVNFVLDTSFEGLKGSAQAGITTYGDDPTEKATLTAGSHFADGRGRIVASGSFYNAQGVDSSFDRPFGRRSAVVLTDPNNPGQSILVDNYHSTFMSAGGLIYGGPGLGLGRQQFGPGGTLLPFNPGTIVNGTQVGGQGAQIDETLIASVRSGSVFTHAEYDITDALTMYLEGADGDVRNEYRQVSTFSIPGYNAPTIINGNPFLPAAVQTIMNANALRGFQLGRVSTDMPPATAVAKNNTYNLVGGFEYKLASDWRLDGYYQHSENTQRIETHNNLNYGNFFAAVDAVRDPASGNIVCRVSLTNPGLYPGCVPINLFGSGTPSAAAIDYVHGTSVYRTQVQQDVAATTLRGSPISLPAGPLALAVGAEYRKEKVDQRSDSVSQTPTNPTGLLLVPAAVLAGAGGWELSNVQPISGSVDVKEAFGELNVPVLADTSVIGAVSLNGAARYTDYSTSGGVTTWKGGATWAPLTSVTLRGTVSRDIRAPNLSELYGGSVQGQNAVLDTRNHITANVVQSQIGNRNLSPETANTYTGGIVFTGVRGLVVSADYFAITVKGVIGTLTPQQTIDGCTASNFTSPLCNNLVYSNPTAKTGLVRVFLPQLNLSQLKTSGVDFEVGYQTNLPGNIGAIQFRCLMTYLSKYETSDPSGLTTDYTGVVGTSNNPRVTALTSMTYAIGGFSFYAQERVIGAGKFQAGKELYNPPLANNRVPAVWYTDLTVKQNLLSSSKLELFLSVNNLFNKYPPLLPTGSFNDDYPTNATLYDVAGRTFTAGARFKF
jgi:iron complex outermembrane receptor protein